jgi:hypothetical protein
VQLSGELAVVIGVIWPRLPAWKRSPITVTPAGGMLADPGARRERLESSTVDGRLAVGAAWSTPWGCGAEALLFARLAYLSLLQARLARMTDTEPQWRHICEVCGVEEILTPSEAFDLGWDYPPRMGRFGVLGPRCCPRCPNVRTVWWALVIDGYTEDMLTEAQQQTVRRIAGEPGSIALSDN